MLGICYKVMTFILAFVTNMKVAKTGSRFLALEALGNCLSNNLFSCNFNK